MTHENPFKPFSGYAVLPLCLALFPASILWFIDRVRTVAQGAQDPASITLLVFAAIGLLVPILVSIGFFIVNPNEARVLVLFGDYRGTVFRNGFCWANPFFINKKISLRARNLNGEKLKVNDKAGNPIEIAAVVLWRVKDTFKALFEVDDFLHFVKVQSEAAVRLLAGAYPYDAHVEGDDHDQSTISLRAGRDEVSALLARELGERLGHAGVEVIEARLSHLAYAPEIAGAMLQRQQATAIVAARQRIVEGAVGMVRMALERLKEENVVDLDPERKAAMVSNLLVVLCGHENAHPVVNAGTLYT